MKRFFRRIGHRGAFLLFLAVLDGLFGYALFHPHILMFNSYLSPKEWAVLWVITGFTCFIQAFMNWDRIAFALAIGMKIAWGALMLQWWLVQHEYLGWIGVVVWWSFAAVIGVVADWPEPVPNFEPELPCFDLPCLDENSEDSV